MLKAKENRHGLARRMRMSTPRLHCPYCQRPIAATHMGRHKKACPERIFKAPIQELTYGEAKASGRMDEFLDKTINNILEGK